jgi:thiamine biosynthesis lipoprotein
VVSATPARATNLPGVRRIEHIMGMPIIVDVRDGAIEHDDLEPVFAWFRLVDEIFSTFRPDSEISRLNRDLLSIREVCPDVREVLQRCETLRVETDGAFDVRAASHEVIDPSGYVKGWSVDRAGAILRGLGAANYSINAGGDVLLAGRALPAAGWQVGVQHPLRRDRLAKIIEATELAIATSGGYERGAHVLDAHTGLSPEGVLSVTVTGPELGIADAFATAAYALGGAAARWLRTLPARGYEGLAILRSGEVLSTPGFPAA